MKTVVCRGCGKIYDWQTGRATVEKFCPECAACMIDERHTNGLLCSDVIEPAED